MASPGGRWERRWAAVEDREVCGHCLVVTRHAEMAKSSRIADQRARQNKSSAPEATMSACGRSAHHSPAVAGAADRRSAPGQASRKQPTSRAAGGGRERG
jgi:hypothetical protein